MPFKLRSETDRTYALKWKAWEWLQGQGCRHIGFEVRLAGPFGKVVDVAALGPGDIVYAVEVKQSLSDFQRDARGDGDLWRLRRQLEACQRRIELCREVVAQAEVYARREYGDGWQSAPVMTMAQTDLMRVHKEFESIQRRLTRFRLKFRDPAFLRAAHLHYIITSSGLVRPRMVVDPWGLLDESLAVRKAALLTDAKPNVRYVLRAIGRANLSRLAAARFDGETDPEVSIARITSMAMSMFEALTEYHRRPVKGWARKKFVSRYKTDEV